MEKRKKCSTFKPFLVKNAEYDGSMELPKLKTSEEIPKRVITFSKAMEKNRRDFDCWVAF